MGEWTIGSLGQKCVGGEGRAIMDKPADVQYTVCWCSPVRNARTSPADYRGDVLSISIRRDTSQASRFAQCHRAWKSCRTSRTRKPNLGNGRYRCHDDLCTICRMKNAVGVHPRKCRARACRSARRPSCRLTGEAAGRGCARRLEFVLKKHDDNEPSAHTIPGTNAVRFFGRRRGGVGRACAAVNRRAGTRRDAVSLEARQPPRIRWSE